MLLVSCLPSYLDAWLKNDSNNYIYTKLQVAKFPLSHLEAGGWYLDYFVGFVVKAQELATLLLELPWSSRLWRKSLKRLN